MDFINEDRRIALVMTGGGGQADPRLAPWPHLLAGWTGLDRRLSLLPGNQGHRNRRMSQQQDWRDPLDEGIEEIMLRDPLDDDLAEVEDGSWDFGAFAFDKDAAEEDEEPKGRLSRMS